MFPNGMLEALKERVTEDMYYETILYETLLGISTSTYDEGLQYIRQALSYNPQLKRSVEMYINHYDTHPNEKALYNLSKDLDIKYRKKLPWKFIINDDVEEYIRFTLENRNSYYKTVSLDDVIRWDSMKILKHILLTKPEEFRHDISLELVLANGNFETIHLIEQSDCGLEKFISKPLNNFYLVSVHNWSVRNWIRMRLEDTKEFDQGPHKSPLSFILEMPGREEQEAYRKCLYTTISQNYDLKTFFNKGLLKESREKTLKKLVTNNCQTILSSISSFDCLDLLYPILKGNFEIVNIMLERITEIMLPMKNHLNPLQTSILTGNIQIVERIIEKCPQLLLSTDAKNNNILHFASMQPSQKIFKGIVKKLIKQSSEEYVLGLLSMKNILKESPMDLLKKFDQEYFMDDSRKTDTERLWKIDEPNYERLMVLYSNTCFVKHFRSVFYNVSHSSSLKFIDTRNVLNFTYMFNRLRECRCLKYWDVSNVVSISGLFYKNLVIKSLKGIEDWDVRNCQKMEYLMYNSKVVSIEPLRKWQTISLKSLECAFLEIPVEDFSPISDWDVSKVENFRYAFENCKMTDLSAFSKWKVRKDTNLSHMFCCCENLTDCSAIDDWEIPKENTTRLKMFNLCDNIKRYPKWF